MRCVRTRGVLVALIGIFLISSETFAQQEGGPECDAGKILAKDKDFKYNRSSLHLVLIESESFPRKKVVMDSWENYPFPDKYDKLDVNLTAFDPAKIPLSDEEIRDAGYSTNPSDLEMRLKDITAGIYDPKDKLMPLKIEKVINKTHLARQLVAQWFDLGDDSTFDMQLVQDRGYYNATEMEAAIAKKSVRGLASLADAGEELINNTFVVFSKLYFTPNEPVAKLFYQKALSDAGKIGNVFARMVAKKAAKAAYKKAKKGYSVWTLSWLYKLVWNPTIANTFYQTMWTDPKAFENSDIFKMEYVGRQGSRSLVTFSLTKNRTENEIIDVATVRNIDNTFAKLQKEYDVFKPKVPVLTSQPLTAQIGMKEGLEGGEQFDVLEMSVDCDTYRTQYDVVDRVRVDKSMVWDNRYKAGLEENTSSLDATHFTGANGKVAVGMLLKQIK